MTKSEYLARNKGQVFTKEQIYEAVLIVVNSLLVIAVLTSRFAKIFRNEPHLLMESTKEISGQNLDFEAGHSKIKEFEISRASDGCQICKRVCDTKDFLI